MDHARTSALKRIRLNLARSKDHPEGSSRHGYEFVAPLDAAGHIDLEGWRENRNACTVRRFWGDEAPEAGRLVHRAGGSRGATWVFDYNETDTDDDEAGFRFADHVFQPGEYVSIRDDDGTLHTFQVVTVDKV